MTYVNKMTYFEKHTKNITLDEYIEELINFGGLYTCYICHTLNCDRKDCRRRLRERLESEVDEE